MGIKFSADEIFEMALRIEQNGAAFYRKAASLHGKQHECGFLLKLADMEDAHYKVFANMRSRLPEKDKEETAFDPYGEASLYLEAMADSHGGEGAPSAADALTGRESLQDILRTALGLEERSILFYLGIQKMVARRPGAEQIGKIIREEESHVATLMAELKKLG